MNYQLLLIGSLIMCSSAQKCSPCSNVSIMLSRNFLFMNEYIKYINISNDRIYINGNNSWIKFFDLIKNNSYCSVHAVELSSAGKLEWVSSLVSSLNIYSNFNAQYALIITWMAYGDNKCDASNLFQVVLTTDDIYSLVIFNFIKINYDSKRNFHLGFHTNNHSNLLLTNHSQLLSNSNVGINGKWIFIVNDKNFSLMCVLNLSLISLGLLFFYLIFNTNY